jgi:hypothetical protein
MMFHVVLHPEEDGWIVAECPALPGCVSQGRDEKDYRVALGRRPEGCGFAAGWAFTCTCSGLAILHIILLVFSVSALFFHISKFAPVIMHFISP